MIESVTNASIEGSQNIVGDNNTQIFNYKLERKAIDQTCFFIPQLRQYNPKNYISPPFGSTVADEIIDSRLIILSDNSTIVQNIELARHIAWHVQFKLSKNENDLVVQEHIQTPNTPQPLDELCDEENTDLTFPVKEWKSESMRNNLIGLLLDEDESTLFILPDFEPQYVRYKPDDLQDIAKSKNHYIVAISAVPVVAWKLPPGQQKKYWRDWTAEEFGTPFFIKHLRKSLKQSQSKLPEPLLERDWDSDEFLAENLSLKEVAEQLHTRDQINLFVEKICQEKARNYDDMQNVIRRLKREDKQANLRSVFFRLDHRTQLLVLALTMFDGLFDDQIFGALDQLVKGAWRQRDPNFKSFDYQDLENVNNLFSKSDEDDLGRIRIESNLSFSRQDVFLLVWETHRRCILSALPELRSAIKLSVEDRLYHRDLYGLYKYDDKVRQIQSVSGETVSALGLISIECVEETLLLLAADDNMVVQATAAEAMARWRIYERDDELFELLSKWMSLSEDESLKIPISNIQATVALTIAYAAAFDRPNELADDLFDLFKQIFEDLIDEHEIIRHRFLVYTLPVVTGQHLLQLEPYLKEMTLRDDVIQPISSSLAWNNQSDTKGILELTDRWQKDCWLLVFQEDEHSRKQREGLLKTLSWIYGYIPVYELGSDQVVTRRCINALKSILADGQESPQVREAAWKSLELIGEHRFADLEPHLLRFVSFLKEGETEYLITNLTNCYLKQRREFEGGEETITWQEDEYPVWITQKRPLTEVEIMLYTWIDLEGNVKANAIALQSFVSFAHKFDEWEDFKVSRIRDKKSAVQELDKINTTEVSPTLSFLERAQIKIASWWVTKNNQIGTSERIQGIFPEALKLYVAHKQRFQFVLGKLKIVEEKENISILSGQLGQVVSIMHNRIIIKGMVAGIVLLIMMACVIFAVVNAGI